MNEILNEELNLATPKEKMPNSIYFILGNGFFESFTFYGQISILSLYFLNELDYSEDISTTVFHAWILLVYFSPILGAVLADSWFGKFNIILYFSILFLIGIVLMFAGSFPNSSYTMKALSITGLVISGIGTGAIKPLVPAIGGDQYKNDREGRKYFFSIYYFSINGGGLLAFIIAPILRADVRCMGSNNCYPLAFTVLAIVLVIATVIFAIGKCQYISEIPERNVLVWFSSCIVHALMQKLRSKTRDKEHWLDYAEDKYEKEFIHDVKLVLRVWFVLMPVPVFWSLFDQIGSRWTIQAEKLNCNLGFFKILPEQMQTVNTILILAMIPLFDYIIYPVLAKKNLLTKLLHRLTVGGIFAAISFVVAGFLERAIEFSSPGSSNRALVEVVALNNSVNLINIVIPEKEMIYLTQMKETETALFKNNSNYTLEKVSFNVKYPIKQLELIDNLNVNNDTIRIFETSKLKTITDIQFEEQNFLNKLTNRSTLYLQLNSINYSDSDYSELTKLTNHSDTTQATYILTKEKLPLTTIFHHKTFTSNTGKNIRPQFNSDENLSILHVTETAKPVTNISILSQIPQYVLLTIGEIMFSISGLAFSYAEAPHSMKSVMQATWLLGVALGNIINIIVAETHMFRKQSWEFFAFAAIMALDMILFGILSYFYKYKPLETTIRGNSQGEVTAS